jgi:hypothetical protein
LEKTAPEELNISSHGLQPGVLSNRDSGPKMKLLEAASFYGTQSKHLFNKAVKGDFPVKHTRPAQC